MRVFFVTPYDPENYGVRCLASCVLTCGHVVHILQLKNHMQIIQTEIPEKEPLCLAYVNGSLVTTDPDRNPITHIEKALYAEAMSKWKPDLIAFSIFGVHQKIFPQIAEIAAQVCPNVFLLAGGTGPTLDPEFFLNNGAHAVLRGEGEEAFPRLLHALEKNLYWRQEPNLAYLENGLLRQNEILPPIQDFSLYPLPLHDDSYYSCIEDNKWYHSSMNKSSFQKNPVRRVDEGTCLTSRGCLGACSYCSADSLRQIYLNKYPDTPKLRMRNFDHIFLELSELKRNKVKYIYFYDDFFICNSEKMHKFFDRYIAEINLPFFAFFHPQQLVNDTTLILHAIKAGCQTFTFGIQSASKDFCKRIYQRKFFTSNYEELFSTISKNGGNITLQFLGGNPLETDFDFEENLKFCKLLPYDFSQKTTTAINIFYLMIFPGAKLAITHPEIKFLPRSMKDFYYKSLLLDIRRMTSDSEFRMIAGSSTFKQKPEKLQFWRKMHIVDMQRAYIREQAFRLRGQEVYFWGAGDVYLYKNYLFNKSKVLNIIIDEEYHAPNTIDGIPTARPSSALTGEKICPIIIFSQQAREIYERIKIKFPLYKDIILCTHL